MRSSPHVRFAAALSATSLGPAEAHAQARSIATEDAREGIAALLAKREPKFMGR